MKDINLGSGSSLSNSTSSPTEYARLGSQVVFAADDGVNGLELWSTDGTQAGTQLLKDLNPGAGDSRPEDITVVGDEIFFTANRLTHGSDFFELWKTDGTEAGTTLLDTIAIETYTSYYNFTSVHIDGQTAPRLFFVNDDGVNGRELWTSDGTTAGTGMVDDLRAGSLDSSPSNMLAFNGKLYFSARGSSGTELYETDGTSAGTSVVKDIKPGSSSSSPSYLTVVGDELYFRAEGSSSTGVELWKTDGTEAGTVLVKDIYPFSSDSFPFDLINVDDTLFFRARDADHGFELWKSDGTEAGTVMVKDIYPGTTNSTPKGMAVADGLLYFYATTDVGNQTFVSDGTEAGTFAIADGAYAEPFTVNDQLFFLLTDAEHGTEIWTTDGTVESTGILKDIFPGPTNSIVSTYLRLTEIDGLLYFGANDGSGQALWQTDGTSEGTVLAADISNPIPMLDIDGHVLAIGQGAGTGVELFISNSTPTEVVLSRTAIDDKLAVGGVAATLSAADLDSSDTHTYALVSGEGDVDNATFTIVGNVLLTREALDFSVKPEYQIRVSATDQIGATVEQSITLSVFTADVLKDIHLGLPSADPENVTQVGSKWFFSAQSSAAGSGLWQTDGTEIGTVLIKQFGTAPENGLREFVNYNGTLYFVLEDATSGAELWKSDGTPGGTVRVKDIFTGTVGSDPTNLTIAGNLLYFVANDGSGPKLWRTDGSDAGTFSVGGVPNGDPSQIALASVNSTLFFTGMDAGGDIELWKSTGSVGTTALVKDIFVGDSSLPRQLTSNGSDLFFVATDATDGETLWTSDGTEAGTQLVKDIVSGEGLGSITELTNVDGTLYFSGDDGGHGAELWVSDGTTAGTHLVQDIATGSAGSGPNQLTNVNGTLAFVADDGVHGSEVWWSDGLAEGTTLAADVRPGTDGSTPTNLLNINGQLYFSADDGFHGTEPWRSEIGGSTTIVADLSLAGNSRPKVLLRSNDNLVVVATSDTVGRELQIVGLNSKPTAVALSKDEFDENTSVGTAIGILSATDPNAEDSHTFTLVDGDGDDDNLRFTIQGSELRTAAEFDFESQQEFSIRVRATDQDGLSVEGVFPIIINDLPELDWGGFELLQDTDSTSDSVGADPEDIIAVGNLVFYTAETPTKGRELWVTDGTGEGTRIIKDFYVGSRDGDFRSWLAFDDKLYFISRDRLWVTDGTDEGTLQLFDRPIYETSGTDNIYLVVYQDEVYFSGQSETHTNSYRLMKTDGTREGTAEVYPDANIGADEFTVFDDRLFFSVNNLLWVTDGTAEGTQSFINSSVLTNPENLTVVSAPDGSGGFTDTMFFTAYDTTHEYELWKTDGTVAGTSLVKDISDSTSRHISQLTDISGTLYFAADDGVHGEELWKSDGTEAGTVMVADINPAGDSEPKWITEFDGAVYFAANDGWDAHGIELWKTDGNGASMVMDINETNSQSSRPSDLVVFDEKLYFSASNGTQSYLVDNGQELWVVDSDGVTPSLAIDFYGGTNSGTPTGMTVATLPTVDGEFEETMVLSARSRINFQDTGYELWRSDGASENTWMISDTVGTVSSNPSNLTESNGLLFYTATHPNLSTELFVSDGTSEGTGLLKDIWGGGTASGPGQLTDVDDRLFFTASSSSGSYRYGRELWTSDGTAEGTYLVKDINATASSAASNPSSLTPVGDKLFFTADDGTGRKLWVSDGTEAGTFIVKDFAPVDGFATIADLTSVGDELFFTANVNGEGHEIWKTDGTESGTVLVRDNYATGNTIVSQLISVTETDELGGTTSTLYFLDRDPNTSINQLWKSDGTTAGTVQVSDFDSTAWPFEQMIDFNGTLYFTSGSDDDLWKTDGTLAGTQRVISFDAPYLSARLEEFTVVGETLYFRVANHLDFGNELWKTDGTEEGTVLVRDIVPGPGSSDIWSLTDIDGTLYFTANDGINGHELWKSDGTEQGTVLIANFTGEDGGSSGAGNITAVGGNLFVTATTEAFGRELYGLFSPEVTPKFSLASADQTVDEDVGLVTVHAELDQPVNYEVRVPVVLTNSTATLGEDYSQLSTHFVFAPGETTASTTVSIADDDRYEQPERFRVSAGATIYADLGDNLESVAVNIQDNDLVPYVSFTDSSVVDSAEGRTESLVVRLSQPTFQEVQVDLSYTGTAVRNVDYNAPYYVRIPAGESEAKINIRLFDDSIPENLETLGVTIASVINASTSDNPGVVSNQVIRIAESDIDNTLPIASFDYSSLGSGEYQTNQWIYVRLSKASTETVVVPFTVSGTADSDDFEVSSPSDNQIVFLPGQRTQYVQLTFNDDNLPEPEPETIVFTLGSPTNAILGANNAHTHIVYDNDILNVDASLELSQATVWEDHGSVSFTVTISEPRSYPVEIPVTFSGSSISTSSSYAQVGVDYSTSLTSVTIPASETSVSHLIDIVNDTENEFNETLYVRLNPSTTANSYASASLRILDNDPYITSATSSTLYEGGTNRGVWAHLSQATNVDVVIPIHVSGTATLGEDYEIPSSVRIKAGERSAFIEIRPTRDGLDEDEESIVVTFLEPNVPLEIREPQRRLTIRDFDGSPSVSWGPSWIWDGDIVSSSEVSGDRISADTDASFVYRVNLSTVSGKDVYVAIDTTGNATRAVQGISEFDYSIIGLDGNGKLKIPAGQTYAEFRVDVAGDDIEEPIEDINLRLQSTINAYLSSDRTRQITLDDDLGEQIGASQGFIDGATAFFDSNFNGVIDYLDRNGNSFQDTGEPLEPLQTTDLGGGISIAIPTAFDVNENQQFDLNEGRWILSGGVDISTGLPVRLQFAAPVGYSNISTLSTLVERLINLYDFDLESANQRVTNAFGLESLNTDGVNPIQATLAGDPSAASSEETAVRIFATIQSVVDLFSSVQSPPSTFLSDVAFGALASLVAETDSLISLSFEPAVRGLIANVSSQSGLLLSSDPAEHAAMVEAAATTIAAGNQALDAIGVSLDIEYLTKLFQVKKVMIGELAPAMREVTEGTRTPASLTADFTGTALEAKIAAAEIGTIIPPSLFIGNQTIAEGDSGQQLIEIEVHLVGDHDLPVSVNYATADDTAFSDAGDYVPTSGTFTWDAGDNTSRTIKIPINGNTTFEPDRNFVVFLSEPANAVLGNDIGYGFILNDEVFRHSTSVSPVAGTNSVQLEIDEFEFAYSENEQLISDGEIALATTFDVVGQADVADSFDLLFLPAAAAHNVFLDGGAGEGDSMIFSDGTFESFLHHWESPASGRTTLKPLLGGTELTVDWSNIEMAKSFAGGVSEIILHLPDGTSDARLTYSNELMHLTSSSGAFEPFSFRSPTDSLVIRATNEDFLTVISADPDFNGALTVVENYVPASLGRVWVESGDLHVTMPGQEEAELSIRLDAETNEYVVSSESSDVEAGSGVMQTTAAMVRVPAASVIGTVIVIGGVGEDNLTIDFSGGGSLPVGGLAYSGAENTDSLTLVGDDALNPDYQPEAGVFGSGSLTVGGRAILFTESEQVDFNEVGRVSLQTPDAVDNIDISDDFLIDGETNALRVSGNSGGVMFTEARIASSSLFIDTTTIDGDDTLNIWSANSEHLNTGLNIQTGVGNDAISVLGKARFGGEISVQAQLITLGASLDASANNATGDLVLIGRVLVTDAVYLTSGIDEDAGNISIIGPVELDAALSIEARQGDVTVAGDVFGKHAVVVESQGETTFVGSVGTGEPLQSLSVDASGSTSVTNVTTVGIQSYGNDLFVSGSLETIDQTISIAGTATIVQRSSLNVGNGLLSFGSTLRALASVDLVAQSLVFGDAIEFKVDGPSVDDQYARLRIDGPIDLNDVQLFFSGSYQPVAGDAFEFVQNDTPNEIIGIFVGTGEGDSFAINGSGEASLMSYVGGDGNDFTAEIEPTNRPPTTLSLSSNSVTENLPTGTYVGALTTQDPDAGDIHAYALVSGEGDDDNASFAITDTNDLVLTSPLNYEDSGTRSIRLRTTDAAGLWTEQSFTILVQDLPELVASPVFGDGTAQRSNITQIVLTFDGGVEFDVGAITLSRTGSNPGNIETNITSTRVNDIGQTEVILGFSGGLTRGAANALVDGWYQLEIDGSKIRRNGLSLDVLGDGRSGEILTIGDEEADRFFAFFGDSDGDGDVDSRDYLNFRRSYRASSDSPAFNNVFDFDGDDDVDARDFLSFRRNYRRTL